MDCFMNATRLWPAALALAERLSRSGPTLPVAAGTALNVWHAPQPLFVKITAPAVPPPPPGCGFWALPAYHLLKAAALITIVSLRIVEWPSPQSSVQITGKVPVLVGVITRSFTCPGTASCFWPKFGTQNE